MAVALGRLAYTRISRRHGLELSYASTGAPSKTMDDDGSLDKSDDENVPSFDLKNDAGPNKEMLSAEKELLDDIAFSNDDAFSTLMKNPVAIFPQYLTTALTTLVIREVSVPHFSDSFSVHIGPDNTDTSPPIFHVTRKIPSFRHKQYLIDARTNEPVMTIRRNGGSLPRSYWFEDPTGAKILDLQGDFFVPFTGAKSRALFKNAAAEQRTADNVVELSMQGSYHNRHADIKEKATNQTVAAVRCNIWNKRVLVGGRRTYVASVRAGADMAGIVGMIVALDRRSD